MPAIDISKMTTDELLQIIPPTETKEWEFKAAMIFDRANFGSFKKHTLGRIVSSFANSGGGYLLLGKRDGEAVFDRVPTHEGRTTMEDHLSLVISQSVVPHYREFEIHRVPISGSTESVLVVEFSDSPMAPHQSVTDTNYYYRLPGHSVAAPHFHLELLRGRFTQSVVDIVDVEFHPQLSQQVQDGLPVLAFALKATVVNTSLQSATAWGIHIKHARTDYRWDVTKARLALTDGTCVRGEQQVLLPGEKAVVTIHIFGRTDGRLSSPASNLCSLAEAFDVVLRPVSQNFIGKDSRFTIDHSDIHRLRRDIESGRL